MWLIANWKSNKNIKEALEWIEVVGPKLGKNSDLKIVVCPEFSAIAEVKKTIMVGNFPIMVGAQDLSPFEEGAYTGEEPAEDLKELITLSILGHSERRENFSETDEMVSEKVKRALEQGIIPLVCVQGKETPVPEGCKLIAFEPVFAIGTGKADTPQNANEVAKFFKRKYGQEMEVLYGGSVNSENISSFLNEELISGCLIGKASLDPEEFLKIYEKALDGTKY